jgi:hypothetical protein
MDATGKTADGKKHTASLEHAVKFATWASPRGTDAKCGSSYTENTTGKDLAKDATLTAWATPNVRDYKDTGENVDFAKVAAKSKLSGQVHGTPPASFPAPTAKPVACRLNPLFSLWLMLGTALATAWASCVPQATRSASRPQRPSSAP